MPTAGWLAVGAVLAGCFVLLAHRHGVEHERRVWALGLIVAALIYVVAAGAQRNVDGLLVEGLGLMAFGAVALVGMVRWPVLLAAGWSLHVIWDVLLHLVSTRPYIGSWYPLLCISFDLIVAGYIAWRIGQGVRAQEAT